MRYTSVFAVLFVLLTGPPAFADVPKILKLSEIQAGTEAIGFSVFKGVEPQPFNVVLGEPIDNRGSYYVLIRISGGPMETPLENIGAASGMSGSPIFVGCHEYEECIKSGTLAGALSASPGFFIEGGMNALMTPAEYMLGGRLDGYSAAGDFSQRSAVLFFGMQGQPAGRQLPRCSEFANSDIKPGSMISVYLAKGTMNVGFSGTVTWRDGEKIYALGHPAFGSGLVEYPFWQVSVADTLQSPVSAAKIPGCELATSGAILVDGAFEIAGVVGQEVKLTPLDVHMFAGRERANLQEGIVYDSPLTTAILRMLPAAWANQTVGDLQGISVAYMARVIIESQPEIYANNVIPAAVSPVPFAELFNRIDNALAEVRKSGFRHSVESIHVDVALTDLRVWKKKEAFLSKNKALPGETVHIHLVLEDQENSELRRISIPVKIPSDFAGRVDITDPAGRPVVNVLVQDGAHFTDPRDKERRAPATLETLIADINKKINSAVNTLYVRQSFPRTKEKREGEKSSARSTEPSVGKWTAVETGELEQFPSVEQYEVVVEKTAILDNYIQFEGSFTINVDVSGKSAEPRSEQKKGRKWYFLFLS